MMTSFEALKKELKLSPSYEQQDQLIALENWCFHHISRDRHYEGDAAQQYQQYVSLASGYLDEFLPNIPSDPSSKAPSFGHLTAIQYASRHGYEQFIHHHAPLADAVLNEGDENKMTSLHHAAVKGYAHTVDALLNKGADAKQLNRSNQTPLHMALLLPALNDLELKSHKETISKNLLKYAPLTLTMADDAGDTVMHLMAAYGFGDILEEVLQENPELARVKNKAQLAPIHTAILNGQYVAVDKLLALEGVSELADGRKRTPLHYAARYASADIVQRCCHAAKNLNCRDGEDKTPLMWAAEAKNESALEILKQQGADATLIDYRHFSVLNYAIQSKQESTVRWVLDNTGDALINQLDAEGHSPLYHVEHSKNPTLEALLVSYGAVIPSVNNFR